VHTFGFGQYDKLNSSVLYNIAKIFSGYNAYIPDPTNLGTSFVNGIANILTTTALDVKLVLRKNVIGQNRIRADRFRINHDAVMFGDFPTAYNSILLG
jgi:hypothetical protein